MNHTEEELYAAPERIFKNKIGELTQEKGRSWIFDQRGIPPSRTIAMAEALMRDSDGIATSRPQHPTGRPQIDAPSPDRGFLELAAGRRITLTATGLLAFTSGPVAVRAKPAPGAKELPWPDRTTTPKISAPSRWHFGRHSA